MPMSEKGVSGVMGLRSQDEELSALKKPLSMLEKSLSLWLWIESEEELLDSAEVLRMSGALRASTLVVESSSVGREILARLIVPGAYLTVQDRGRAVSSPRVRSRARLVKLRTRDIMLRLGNDIWGGADTRLSTDIGKDGCVCLLLSCVLCFV